MNESLKAFHESLKFHIKPYIQFKCFPWRLKTFFHSWIFFFNDPLTFNEAPKLYFFWFIYFCREPTFILLFMKNSTVARKFYRCQKKNSSSSLNWKPSNFLWARSANSRNIKLYLFRLINSGDDSKSLFPKRGRFSQEKKTSEESFRFLQRNIKRQLLLPADFSAGLNEDMKKVCKWNKLGRKESTEMFGKQGDRWTNNSHPVGQPRHASRMESFEYLNFGDV